MRRGILIAILLLAGPMGAASASETVYVSTLGGIFKVDTATGDRTLVSGWGLDGEKLLGSGPADQPPGSLELGPDGKVAYGMTPGALLRIDLETGDRTLVSAAETLHDSSQADKAFGPRGEGPAEEDLFADRGPVWDDFVLDVANGRAVVLEELGGPLWAIDLDSGDRRRLWGKRVRKVTERPSDNIEPAATPDRVLLFKRSIWSASLESATAERLHNGETTDAAGDSLNWIGCQHFAVDPERERAALLCGGVTMPVSLHDLPWEITDNFVLGVDLRDGERTMIAGPDRGSGFAFWDQDVTAPGSAIAWDGAADRILILPEMGHCTGSPLVAIDPDTGDRRILSFKGQCNDRVPDIPTRGSGPRLNSGAIAVAPAE